MPKSNKLRTESDDPRLVVEEETLSQEVMVQAQMMKDKDKGLRNITNIRWVDAQ